MVFSWKNGANYNWATCCRQLKGPTAEARRREPDGTPPKCPPFLKGWKFPTLDFQETCSLFFDLVFFFLKA